MTAPPASATGPAARATRYVASLSHPGVLVLAAALPALFLHVDYQPQASFALGGADVKVTLADVALVAVLVAAVHAGRRLGWEPLSRARAPLVAAVVLLGVVVAWTLLPVALDREYPFAANAVTAAKYVEYALLAPATALLVRRPGDLRPTLVVFVVWAGAAAIGAVLQFVGVLPEPRGYRPGEREPSFLGYHDLGAVAGACLAVALVRVALGSARDRVLTWIALTAGVLGVVLSGALAAFVGISAAALAAGAVARARGALTPRRLGALVAIVAVTGVGVTALRVANIEAFLRFIGVTKSAPDDTFGGESYVQRLALGYIGIRIYRDHPLEGVGWQASSLPWAYDPYLDDARERYPRLPERLLPGPNRDWGVQNAYIQAAADLGVVGALAFLAVYLVPLRRAWRTATRTDVDAEDSAVPLLWLLVTMGIWLGLGIVAGIPTVAVQWLAVGLVVAAAARARADRPAYP